MMFRYDFSPEFIRERLVASDLTRRELYVLATQTDDADLLREIAAHSIAPPEFAGLMDRYLAERPPVVSTKGMSAGQLEALWGAHQSFKDDFWGSVPASVWRLG